MIKNLYILIFSFLYVTLQSQSRAIVIDYTVDYVVPNKQKKSNDTISIGFNKDGKYLWTNDANLTRQFGKEVFLGGASKYKNSDFNLIYDVEENSFLVAFQLGKSKIYADMDIASIYPESSEDRFDENITLINEALDKKEKLLGYIGNLYELYPNTEPNERIKVLFADKFACNNNFYFSKFVTLMLQLTGSNGNISADIPNGLILKAYDIQDEILLEAIDIDTKIKTLLINYSFQIKE